MDDFENKVKSMPLEKQREICNRLYKLAHEEVWKRINEDQTDEIQLKAHLLVTERYFKKYPAGKEAFDKIFSDNYEDISEKKEEEGFEGYPLDNEIEKGLLSLYYKKFPDEEEEFGKFHQENYAKFISEILVTGSYLKGNEWEEAYRDTIRIAAEEFGLEHEVIVLINRRKIIDAALEIKRKTAKEKL